MLSSIIVFVLSYYNSYGWQRAASALAGYERFKARTTVAFSLLYYHTILMMANEQVGEQIN